MHAIWFNKVHFQLIITVLEIAYVHKSLLPCILLEWLSLVCASFLGSSPSSSPIWGEGWEGGWGFGEENGLGVLRVDLIAFTWSLSSFDFGANSSPNKEGETSPDLCDDLCTLKMTNLDISVTQ